MTTALLCDHAQVRDGLLFVLSGGVSRVLRESFPAAMGTCLALVLEFDSIEAEGVHQLEIMVVGGDGEDVASVQAEVRVENPEGAKPGENVHLPVAVDLRAAGLGKPGAYELRVYVDSQHRRTLQFWAEQLPDEGTLLL